MLDKITHYVQEGLVKNFAMPSGELSTLVLRQAAYLPFSLMSGNLALALNVHVAAAAFQLVRQPSKLSLKKTLRHYNISEVPKTKFNYVAAGIAVGTILAVTDIADTVIGNGIKDVMMSYDNNYEPLRFAAQSVLRLGYVGEALATFYSLSSRVIPLTKFFMKNNNFKNAFSIFSSKKSRTKDEEIQLMQHLVKVRPKEGLAAAINLFYDKGQKIKPLDHEIPLDLLFHMIGKKSLYGFLISKGGMKMEGYEDAFFERAKKDAIEQKDLSALSLLSLHDYMDNNSTNCFEEQIKLLFEDLHLQKKVIGEGTFTDAITLTYGTKKEPLEMTLVQKISTDEKRLREKKQLNEIISETYPRNVQKMFDLSFHENAYVLTELRMRHPLLYDVLRKNPELFEKAYELLTNFQEVLDTNKSIELVRLDLEKKYLHNPLINSQEYISSIESTQDLFEKIGEYKPLLDFHAKNIVVAHDRLINIDIENKGRGPTMLDIVNLFDFSYGATNYSQIKKYKQKIFTTYQEKLDIETPLFDELYLRSLEVRRNSFVQARRKESGFTEKQEIQKFLNHTASVFLDYKEHSSQGQLAAKQLQLTNELYTLV